VIASKRLKKRETKPIEWLSGARLADVVTVAFIVLACLAVAYLNSKFLFGEWTIPKGDEASNDILVTDAKHLALFHGNYSRLSFYHPGPFYFQWMAIFEWLFVDTLRIFVSPYASEYFSVAALHILAFALYLRLWLLWTGSIWLAVAALLITNAVPFGVIGSNYIGTTWPPHMYVASALMTVTGLLGMAARGPSWLPLFVFGLAQLVHGHASFIGLAPIMASTAMVAAWIGGRLPPNLWRRANAVAYVKAHPRPFYFSAAIAALFALPILINTIVAWPGELPTYFQFAGGQSHPIGEAFLYVVSFVPMWGIWSVAFLLPAKHSELRPAPADYRFAGLLVLVTGGVPAVFYAWQGVDSFAERYLILWMLPFIGAALVLALFYFASFFSAVSMIPVTLIAMAAIVSFKAYGVIQPIYPDIRSTTMTAAALDLLEKRAVPGAMIALKLNRDPNQWTRVWPEAASLIALMNRRNQHFLCIEPGSWHLLFHERYLCKPSDKISETLYIVSENTPPNERLAELRDAEIVPSRR
jgi:hypothetical protein